ncbi:hypothetical protein [Halovivax limisalsi]|uniref:hypothetical protein n=1 Tax=Halovivax limisalsi TaxID=1453760 RepID=UPI001FFCA310|nr:hypothetical protein [Halovivax limisalsi]
MELSVLTGAGFVLLAVLLVLYSAVHHVADGEKEALYVSGEMRTVLDEGITVVPPFVSETRAIDPETMTIETDDGRVDVPDEFEAEVRETSPPQAEH